MLRARLVVCGGLLLGTACGPVSRAQVDADAPVGAWSAAAAQRDPDVPELPFPDNPDPSQCGIPMPWGDYPGWVSGEYQGQLVQPTVFLYDSHERLRVTGSVPSGTQVQVELYQPNPVLDFYYVRVDLPSGQQKGWVPAPFLQLTPPAR